MTTHQLVRTEHLNQYGLLFGGQLLSWVDEAAAIAARLDYPGCDFVTVGLDEVAFRRGVAVGSVLALKVTRQREGNSSVAYRVSVTIATDPAPGHPRNSAQRGDSVFSTVVTVVRIDAEGAKQALRSN